MPTHPVLQDTINTVRMTDYEMRRILNNASQEAERLLAGMSERQFAQAARIEMARVNLEAWTNIGHATQVGIGDGVYAAKEMSAKFDESLFHAAGMNPSYWRPALIAQAGEGVNNLLARKENGITLSQRVYQNQALSKGKIDDIINSALALGQGPKDIAKQVKQFINPNVPGGASYAAMRLGRSEVLNAYHTTSIKHYQDTPWIELAHWHLSGSHPKPDDCNRYAETVHVRGAEAGQYRTADIPAKPHPNCLCYISPVTMDLKKFKKQFDAGKYDDFVNDQMGCSRVA